jgi:hypothetical protein
MNLETIQYLEAAPTSELQTILDHAVSWYGYSPSDCKFIANIIVKRKKHAATYENLY